MKICWDNLEGLRYSKRTGKWYKGTHTYIYKESCKKCGEPFLSKEKGKFCSSKCIINKVGKEHPMYGRKHTEETKKKMSKSKKNKCNGKNNNMYGRKHTEEAKKKMGIIAKNRNGGYHTKNIPFYDTYAHQIEWCEEVRRNKEDGNVLEVRCFKCNEWYIPKINNLRHRIQSLKSQIQGECRLYCSDECKNTCPIYRKKPETLMKEDAIRAGRLPWLELDREMQPELRQMVLERDEYQCVKCGSKGPLYCHHIYPASIEFIESADVDNCMTLCYDCHWEVHQKDGCRLGQLRMEICI